jgi:hypothetical protein
VMKDSKQVHKFICTYFCVKVRSILTEISYISKLQNLIYKFVQSQYSNGNT